MQFGLDLKIKIEKTKTEKINNKILQSSIYIYILFVNLF